VAPPNDDFLAKSRVNRKGNLRPDRRRCRSQPRLVPGSLAG
jgi:hypothetical protein